MRVFEFRVDYAFEALNSETPLSKSNMSALRKCDPDQWEGLDCYVSDPLLLQGSFFKLSSRIVTKPELSGSPILEILSDFGVFCDLTVEGKPGYQVWFPMNVLDVLDLEEGEQLPLSDYEGVSFKKELLKQPTLFRLPNLPGRQFLTTGYGDIQNEDLYAVYQQLGLKGLEFVPAWESS